MDDSGNNGLVTLALIQADIRALRSDIQALSAQVTKRIDDHEDRIRVSERELIRQGQQISGWAGFQAALTIVASSIAALLGSRP